MSVFDEFRSAWRQAVSNFWEELEAEDEGGQGVYREVATARNQLEELDDAIAETRQRMTEETAEAEACVRRERMASEIDDEETARVAREYGRRHVERAEVLKRKLEALEAERTLCRRDLKEMERALQEGRVAPQPELEDLNRHPSEADFQGLEENARDRSASERLADLKRRMGK
jgi:hypothetical protein